VESSEAHDHFRLFPFNSYIQYSMHFSRKMAFYYSVLLACIYDLWYSVLLFRGYPFPAVLDCLYRASPRLSVPPCFSDRQGGRALRAAPDMAWHLSKHPYLRSWGDSAGGAIYCSEPLNQAAFGN
jgi:hypothetical protein